VAKPSVSARWRPSRNLIVATAVVAATGLVVGVAVAAPGYDAQDTPRLETAVWVTRADTGMYARVNTDLGEIDTVKQVDDPTTVVQTGARGVVLTQSGRQLWPIDPANPLDFSSQTESAPSDTDGADAATEGDAAEPAAEPTSEPTATADPTDATDSETRAASLNAPSGTKFVAQAGNYIAYLTDLGKVFLGRIANNDGGFADPSSVDPVDPYGNTADEGEDAPNYAATAIAVTDEGDVILYSAEESAVRRFSGATGQFTSGPVTIQQPPAASANLELAVVGKRWIMSDATARTIWIDGKAGAISTGLQAGARLQHSDVHGTVAYMASPAGLVTVDLGSGAVSEPVTAATGTPAAPITVAGVTYSAWISATRGTLWSSDDDARPIDVIEESLKDLETITPVFRDNGDRVVLNETTTGMLWSVPSGALIPMDQWSIVDETQSVGTVKVEDVTEQKPPVALDDDFGVRSGRIVRLPVLLNDSDPNRKDVLTIDAASIKEGTANQSFGEVQLVDDQQQATVRVRANSGSTTFTYAVTDGSATSKRATVKLHVVPESSNSDPKWCATDGCVQRWPTPQIAPGGTISVPVLAGWVDPDGDPIVLQSATKDDPKAPIIVVPLDDGKIAIRHIDPNIATNGTIGITVTVADDHGGSATKVLQLSVSSNPTLDVRPVSVLAGTGQRKAVTIADHVTGGSGSFRLVDATASGGSDGLVIVPNAAAGQLEVSASKPGNYVLTYTVQDVVTQAEQSAIVRLTVVGGNGTMTMAPLTAFVRANEDTTIDVLGAVQNTSDRVLIVSGVRSKDPALTAGVVAQSAVRVRATSSKAEPGLVGTAIVTISDGNGGFVEGELTVFLIPRSTDVGPIAVPDTVTVRASSQIDIPVTANDVSPQGERVVVSPDFDGSGAKDELAFVTGNSVRYLAPAKPGTYSLTYSIYLESEPNRLASTTITVTVTAKGANRPPQPPTLVGHALAGQTIAIPVNGYGMDPDGDAVVLSGVEQPKAGAGVAVISAEGDAILYTAPGDGVPGGQANFSYTMRDSVGDSATGQVQVGVLDVELSETAPITYTDYVQVQAGSTIPVTVEPLVNDSDPAQGSLSIESVVPNAAKLDGRTGEFERLDGLLDASARADGVISLRAGDVPGVHSYIYDVVSTKSASNAYGLIIVTVAEVAAPSAPLVADTIITAKTRNSLAAGIDVVAGHVRWPGGTIADLSLKVWGPSASRYTVTGHSISGPAPSTGDLVPFSLSGSDSVGNEVTAYGFLKIPAFNDMRLQLKSGLPIISVEEEKTVTFDVLKSLDVDAGDAVEQRTDGAYTVQRGNSSCEARGTSQAAYTSGREEPWADFCVVPVRLAGQTQWTMLAIPIAIQPQDPLAQLNPLSVTIAPGTGATSIDLYTDMTSWKGGRLGDTSLLDYTTDSSSAGSFVVTRKGDTGLSIIVNADAVPGTQEAVKVSVSNFGGLSTKINLIVGIAPDDAPKGATFTHKCDAGKPCVVPLVGVAGEYDPLKGNPRSGLVISSVGTDTSVACAVGTVIKKGSKEVSVTWPASPKPNGGECIVPFGVDDAQGRSGVGQMTLEVAGFPQTPASLTTIDYSPTTVTLQVALGEAANAKPSVNGVTLFEDTHPLDSSTYSCNPSAGANYKCVVTGLVNGVQHHYQARAVSSFGSSEFTSELTTSSYKPPVVSAVSGVSVYVEGRTKKTVSTIKVTITSTDDTESFRIPNALGTTGKFSRTDETTTRTIEVTPGTFDINVIPISRYSPPIGTAGNEGALFDGPVITAIGGPYFDPASPTAEAQSNTSIQVSNISLIDNGSGVGTVNTTYIAWSGSDNGPACTSDGSGGYTVAAGGVQSASALISGLDSYKLYKVKVCGTNGFGVAESDIETNVFTGTHVDPPVGTFTYTVNQSPDRSGYVFDYDSVSTSSVPGLSGFDKFYVIDNEQSSRSGSLQLDRNSVPSSVGVEYCSHIYPSFCSDQTSVTATGAPTFVRVQMTDQCPLAVTVTDEHDVIDISLPARYSADLGYSYNPINDKATFTVTWTGDFADLDPIDITYNC
jgi:large repetitive protein